ncbi:hypothetical protein Tco_1213988 [Tanacetum coccineum]
MEQMTSICDMVGQIMQKKEEDKRIADEHLDTIPEIESDEIIKSSVENLVPIPSEFEGIFDNTCDVPVCEDPSTFYALKDHSEILSDSNDDGISSDDDDFEDIEYVSLEKVNDAEKIDLEIFFESMIDSFFKESNTSFSYSDNSLPEFEPFSDDTEGDGGELTNVVIEEVDTFLVSEDSIPLGFKSNFDPGGGEIDFSQNVKDDDSFTFFIRTFLPFLTYPADSPLLLSSESEDTIFDPGKRIENEAKTRIIGLNLVKSNYYSSQVEVVKCPRACQWKEHGKTSPTVPSDFIGPARNPLNGPDQPKPNS